MEVIVIVVVGAVVFAFVAGLFMWIAEIIGEVWSWLREIWPFVLGCLIGIPLSFSSSTKILGNLIVAIGIVGNVFWLKWLSNSK